MFTRNDVVVITTETPKGASENVLGRLGIITEIYEEDGVKYYTVKDTGRTEYVYIASELRYANDLEIKEKFIELVTNKITMKRITNRKGA